MKLKNKRANEAAILETITRLKEMQQPVDYQLIALTEHNLTNAVFKRIPWLNELLRKIHKSGGAITGIGQQAQHLDASSHAVNISQGFHFGSIAVFAFDFIRIPLLYLAAYLLDKQIIFNLNYNAQWLYSTVLLALSITALAAPVTAPIIAFVVAGVILATSLFLMGQTIYQRYQLVKDKKLIEGALSDADEHMQLLQQKAKELEIQLVNATDNKTKKDILHQVERLQIDYNAQKLSITNLKNTQLHLEQKIADASMMKLVDRSVATVLASLSVVGLVLSLFFPPVGFMLLAAVAITGGAYTLGRIFGPIITSFTERIISQFNAGANITKNLDDTESLNPSPRANLTKEEMPILDSTTGILQGLSDKNNAGGLVNLHQKREPNKEPLIKASVHLVAEQSVPSADPDMSNTDKGVNQAHP
ncbi:MAG: hypothetical protein PSV35_10710 [bacterium]|nr:hypothetical protein [bacterium]